MATKYCLKKKVKSKVMALVLSLEVLHTALVIDMISLNSLLQIDGSQVSTI